MSMSDRAKLELLLRSCGVAPINEIDDSVLGFLFEALNSNALTNNEKAEWLSETIPSLRTQPRQVVLGVIVEFCNPQRQSSAARPKQKVPSGGAETKSDLTENVNSPIQKIADDIKEALINNSLEGSDIVEVELVEYLMAFVAEMQIDNHSLSSSNMEELESVLTSFFTDVTEGSDALTAIVDILVTANVERKKIDSSGVTNACKKTAASSSNSNSASISASTSASRSAGISADKNSSAAATLDGIHENDNKVTRDDILSLICMMPFTPKDLIRYVYTILCSSNRVEAARYLVESSDPEGVEKLQLSKETYEKKERESATLSAIQKKKMKATVCSKYGDLLVRDKFDIKGKELKTIIQLPIQFIDEKEKDRKVKQSGLTAFNLTSHSLFFIMFALLFILYHCVYKLFHPSIVLCLLRL